MKPLQADWLGCWRLVWERDVPYHVPQRCWFNQDTGEVLWQETDSPEDVLPEDVQAAAETWEEIPALTHGEHHEIFARFVAEEPTDVRSLCNTKSIGGFFETYEYHFEDDSDVRARWRVFHDQALRQLAVGRLRQHGWAVD